MIEAQQLSKIYSRGGNPVSVLERVSLKVWPNELVVISGASGSGKTTLLNILGCLDRPSAGRLLLEGTNTDSFTRDELARLRGERIGFVFQHSHLLRQLSALENILLPLTLNGQRREDRRALELLEVVGLTHRAHHKPSELSGGEQQRVAIARALIRDPGIILADEPTGNLDQKNGSQTFELLTGMVGRNRSVVIVTHQPEMIVAPARHFEITDGVLHEPKSAAFGLLMTRDAFQEKPV
jgi:ABC-type lipoprotein export system ATPase subunit